MSGPAERAEAPDRDEAEEGKLPPSPASQVGRLRQSRGTPPSRRPEGRETGVDDEEWKQPVEEDGPLERGRPAPDG